MKFKHKPILVKGEDNLTCSIAVCMLNAGHSVILYTQRKDARDIIDMHLSDQKKFSWGGGDRSRLTITDEPGDGFDSELAILLTPEDPEAKISALRHLQSLLSDDAVMAVNTESIPLSKLQEGALFPCRIVGMNWSEPAHTTFFLEIISNDTVEPGIVDDISSVARDGWNKDPYVLTSDLSVRSRMIAAMVREAFYLLDNGYVSIEDIDRACRNDAGYYLPFAGHCRYMDLMGTFVYGKVMEDLNPELSKETKLSEFFNKVVSEGKGMQEGKGFYAYDPGEREQRMLEFRTFSYEIGEIISRYPFRYQAEKLASRKKISSSV